MKENESYCVWFESIVTMSEHECLHGNHGETIVHSTLQELMTHWSPAENIHGHGHRDLLNDTLA